MKEKLDGWKTPQIKSCFEPIMMAQKECEGTFLNNMLKYGVGLLNTSVKVGEGMFPSNVVATEEGDDFLNKYFLLPKPAKEEKGDFNTHKTVKPLAICEYIIKLTTSSKTATVLDPFVGSGTTAVAAKRLSRRYIGIDSNREYVAIAAKRLANVDVVGDTAQVQHGRSRESQLEFFEEEKKRLARKNSLAQKLIEA